MKTPIQKLISLFLCLSFLLAAPAVLAAEEPAVEGGVRSTEELEETIIAVIDWKKADVGASPDEPLLNDRFLGQAGSTPGDWFPIGLGRFGYEDDYAAYLSVIAENVSERYKGEDLLSAAKATEWHRISLAVLAMGGDPTAIGADRDGKPIHLIADGVYNRGEVASLGKQGINGWIWGLIALDSLRYPIPEGAFYSRDDIILEILRRQLPDGGFALTGEEADPDITAMALQALSPYYNNKTTYSYTVKSTGEEVTRTVRQIVDEALSTLSALQKADGDFASWGTENMESTAQVIVALCSLGIDPERDERFIKNGNTLLDGLLKYRTENGGFTHSFAYDAENPTALPGEANTMASEQALYTLVSVWRYRNGMRSLYDFRAEWDDGTKAQLNALQEDIASADLSDAAAVASLFERYKQIDPTERCYISHFHLLADAMAACGVENDLEESTVVSGNAGDREEAPLLFFSEADKAETDALPSPLSTEQYVAVVKLLDKCEQSDDFEGKEAYLEKLRAAKAEIDALQAEIDAINADVLENLYPFENISLKDKGTVDEIVARYERLSDYDKQKIQRAEDILKAKIQVDNLARAVWIAAAIGVAAVIIAVVTVLRIRSRRRKKRLFKEMPVEDEEDDA